MKPLTLSYSIADQNFRRTKSIGILNLSLQLFEALGRRREFARLTLLTNRTLTANAVSPQVQKRMHNLGITGKLGRIIWDQWGCYRAAARAGNDWLFLPKGFASFCGPCPVWLITCVADANHDYYQRQHPRSVSPMEMWYFQRCIRATIQHSSLIFTISDFTTSEVHRLATKYELPCPPVRTMGIGFSPTALAFEARKNSIVVLAGRWPHKRTDLAIQYLESWQRQTNFAGTIEWIGSLPNELQLPQFHGWRRHLRLPEAEYRRLLSTAKTLVYFSDYEGFGMPPVEAAIAGTCPVYSDLPATREVMGGAGWAFQNDSYDSFAQALESALKTPMPQLETWREELLRRHQWSSVAERVVHALSELEREAGPLVFARGV